MKIDKEKLRTHLEKEIGRIPLPNEITNGEKDALLLVRILFEKVEELELRVKKLEQ